MSNRVFYGVLVTIVALFVGSAMISKKPEQKKVSIDVQQHKDLGGNHVAQGTVHKPYNSELPSSGEHYADASAPAQWGIYVQEVPAEVFLHNMEHGGVTIAYRPDLPTDQIRKLQKLFAEPSSDKGFSAGKYILTPRAANKYPIEMAAWRRTYNIQKYDAAKIKAFYTQNVSNKMAPESFAGPTNKPINQAASQ